MKKKFSIRALVIFSSLSMMVGIVLGVLVLEIPNYHEFVNNSSECEAKLIELDIILEDLADRAAKLNNEKMELMAKLKILEDRDCD